MKEIWEKRYHQNEYIYGKSSNEFFKEFIEKFEKILLPAESAGRNADYSSLKDWEVTTFNFSQVAKNKSLFLAEQNNVRIDYTTSDTQDYKACEKIYDLFALISVNFPTERRTDFFNNMIKSLNTGDCIILQVHSKEQLNYGTGGPKDMNLLYDLEDFELAFRKFKTIKLEKLSKKIFEGDLHNGVTSIIEGVFQ